MTRALKILVACGLAVTVASCGTVRRVLPSGFGGAKAAEAQASEGQRISVLSFDQTLTPAAALEGRDFLIGAPQPVVTWPQPGGTPENAVEHVQAAENFAIAWRRDIGQGSNRRKQVTSPIVADSNRIFVMDGDSGVVAVDADSGQIAWRANVRPEGRERDGFGGGLAVGGGRVFVASGYRTMTALDQQSGAVVWQSRVDAPIHGAPTVSGSRVYVVDVDNQLIAFNVANGQQDWSYRGIVEPARILRASSPAVTGDTVITPFSSGELTAVRASTGQAVWQQTLSRTSRTSALSEIRDIAGRPVVSRGFVYAVSHSGVLAALDVRSGQPRWTLPVASVNAPLPTGDVVYVVSKAGELAVAARDNGQVYFTRDLNAGRQRNEGGVFGLFDRQVTPQWSGPILASNRLVLVNSYGEAVALNPKTGETLATLRLGAPAYIAPAAYNGALYVLTDEGQLVSIR